MDQDIFGLEKIGQNTSICDIIQYIQHVDNKCVLEKNIYITLYQEVNNEFLIIC